MILIKVNNYFSLNNHTHKGISTELHALASNITNQIQLVPIHDHGIDAHQNRSIT